MVPLNIVKPKPQDCGKNLYICLNPQLKMVALRDLDSSLYVDTEKVIKYTEMEQHESNQRIRQKKSPIS